jgi:ABC-type nitrate/sulfonate/bicarbonate transport system permease component
MANFAEAPADEVMVYAPPGEGHVSSVSDPELRAPRSKLRLRSYLRSRALGWTLVGLILVAWQVSSAIHNDPAISAPAQIAQAWWQQVTHGSLPGALATSLKMMVIGFAIAVPLGVGIGFLMGRSRVIWGLLEPLVEIIRLTPVTAILPVYVLFFGIGTTMQIAVFLTAGLFPLIINSYAGAQGVSKILGETAQTFRLNWIQTQREIALPFAVPYILVGMRQALGNSLVFAVVIGMLVGENGIGYYILGAQQDFDVDQLLAGVVSVAAVGYLFNAIFLLLERRATRWRRAQTGAE